MDLDLQLWSYSCAFDVQRQARRAATDALARLLVASGSAKAQAVNNSELKLVEERASMSFYTPAWYLVDILILKMN